jgi:hypothetical protein
MANGSWEKILGIDLITADIGVDDAFSWPSELFFHFHQNTAQGPDDPR